MDKHLDLLDSLNANNILQDASNNKEQVCLRNKNLSLSEPNVTCSTRTVKRKAIVSDSILLSSKFSGQNKQMVLNTIKRPLTETNILNIQNDNNNMEVTFSSSTEKTEKVQLDIENSSNIENTINIESNPSIIEVKKYDCNKFKDEDKNILDGFSSTQSDEQDLSFIKNQTEEQIQVQDDTSKSLENPETKEHREKRLNLDLKEDKQESKDNKIESSGPNENTKQNPPLKEKPATLPKSKNTRSFKRNKRQAPKPPIVSPSTTPNKTNEVEESSKVHSVERLESNEEVAKQKENKHLELVIDTNDENLSPNPKLSDDTNDSAKQSTASKPASSDASSSTKDPALLSVSQRKALFEKNASEALMPKAPFTRGSNNLRESQIRKAAKLNQDTLILTITQKQIDGKIINKGDHKSEIDVLLNILNKNRQKDVESDEEEENETSETSAMINAKAGTKVICKSSDLPPPPPPPKDLKKSDKPKSLGELKRIKVMEDVENVEQRSKLLDTQATTDGEQTNLTNTCCDKITDWILFLLCLA